MSRIGAAPINIPAGVSVEYNNGSMLIKSAKAEKEVSLIRDVVCQIIDNQLLLSVDQDKDNYDKIKPMWGTYRSNINNIINGMVDGFSVNLEINGVGYKAECDGKYLTLYLGYSHNVKYKVPKDVEIKCIKPTHLVVSGMDKQKVYMEAFHPHHNCSIYFSLLNFPSWSNRFSRYNNCVTYRCRLSTTQ